MITVDPLRGARPAKGANGTVMLTSHLSDAAIITPDDAVVYDPPITVWVGSSGNVAVVPYGLKGDAVVAYPMLANRTVPVLACRVLAAGTTSALLIGQQAVAGSAPPPPPTGPTADSTLVTADSTLVTADRV